MQQLLTFNQIVSLIKAVGDKRTIIVEGENGIGKTALFHALKKDVAFAEHIAVDPIDCTQLSDGSVWMPDIDRDNGISRELPNERFGVNKHNQKGINNAKPALIFLDEIAKAYNDLRSNPPLLPNSTTPMSLGDIFVLRPWDVNPNEKSTGAADAIGDNTSTAQLRGSSFALVSAGRDRKIDRTIRRDVAELNKDNVIEVSK